ncbi:MAG: transcriptional regulator [Flavobacteriaceae bacterium]|nr:transcriptional regulator [Flavobacteriaceae bacterium]|tara:strand:- start:1672 stop:2076 length:405 start_codon:yes stop_codon:yes gene_type:complete
MLNNTAIVSRIEEVRKNHQLTAASFATKIGVQRSAISHILSGRNKPSLEFLMKIHDSFDEVNLEWLILGKPTPLSKNLEIPANHTEINQLTNVLDNMLPVSKSDISNESESAEAPKEIIYLYENGKFERFTPKK